MYRWLQTQAGSEACHQTYLKARINRRERKTRVTVFVLLIIAAAILGSAGIATVLMLLMLVVETCEARMHRYLNAADKQLLNRHVCLSAGLAAVATSVYMGASLVFAQHATTSVVLLGLFWLSGGLVHLSANYASMPVFYWATMTPATLILLVFPMTVGWSEPRMPLTHEWLMPLVLAVIYVVHLRHLMSSQKDTEAAIETARKQAASRLKELEYLANHDSLTGLLNRGAFDIRIQEMLISQRGADSHLAMFMLDLDGFKPINDLHGHEAGDVVLAALGQRLEKSQRAGACVARLGGDEFGVLANGIEGVEDALGIGNRLRDTLNAPVRWRGQSLQVGVSIGVALQMISGNSPQALMSDADQAMYRAKALGKNRVVVFDGTASVGALGALDEELLRSAVTGDGPEFVLRYRKVAYLSDLSLQGLDASVYWDHPEAGLLGPDHYLSTLDAMGLLGDYTYKVLKMLLMELETLLIDGIDPGQVSISVPELSLSTHNGREDIEWLMATFPGTTERLTLTVPENLLLSRSGDLVAQSIVKLRQIGVKIALDDFGSGQASFQHLRSFAIDGLRIHPSFVSGVEHDQQASIILDGFLSIAQGLGVTAMAKGIESDDQRRHLAGQGCPTGIGSFIGADLPLDEILQDLQKTDTASRIQIG